MSEIAAKVLHLTLKKKWFDMIASGEKREEYREIKTHWNRILNKEYDVVKFRNGYAKDSPVIIVELKRIFKGYGFTEWGAPEKQKVYILELGKQLKSE